MKCVGLACGVGDWDGALYRLLLPTVTAACLTVANQQQRNLHRHGESQEARGMALRRSFGSAAFAALQAEDLFFRAPNEVAARAGFL